MNQKWNHAFISREVHVKIMNLFKMFSNKMSACPSVRQFICPSVCLSICQSVHLLEMESCIHIYQSLCKNYDTKCQVIRCQSVHLSDCSFVNLSVCTSVHRSYVCMYVLLLSILNNVGSTVSVVYRILTNIFT